MGYYTIFYEHPSREGGIINAPNKFLKVAPQKGNSYKCIENRGLDSALLNSGERYAYWTGDQPVSGNSKTEWQSLWFVGDKNNWKLQSFRALEI